MRISKAELCERLSAVKQVISDKTMIEAAKGAFIGNNKIIGTNLTTYIIAEINTYDCKPFILPIKAINMIEQMPEGFIEIKETKPGRISVSNDIITSEFSTYKVEEYPEVPDVEKGDSFAIRPGIFKDAVSATEYLCNEKSSKAAYAGICIDGGSFVSCDGIRLVKYDVSGKVDFDKVPKSVIPKRIARLVSSIVPEDNRDSVLTLSDKYIKIDCGEITFVARKIDGEYLDWRAILKHERKSVTLKTDDIRSCVIRGMVSSSAVLPTIDVKIDRTVITISSNSETSSYEEVIPVYGGEGADSLTIRMNALRLSEMLRKLKSENVVMEYSNALGPVVFTSEELVAMILPVRQREQEQKND